MTNDKHSYASSGVIGCAATGGVSGVKVSHPGGVICSSCDITLR